MFLETWELRCRRFEFNRVFKKSNIERESRRASEKEGNRKNRKTMQYFGGLKNNLISMLSTFLIDSTLSLVQGLKHVTGE